MSGTGQTSEGQCAIGGMQDDVKDGRTAGGASIPNKEHNSPRTLVGVRVVASLLGHSRLDRLCSRA